MNRITPRMVLDAYRLKRLKPRRGGMQIIDGKVCALGVVGMVQGLNYTGLKAKYGASYIIDFLMGFDGVCDKPRPGVQDGSDVAKAVEILL